MQNVVLDADPMGGVRWCWSDKSSARALLSNFTNHVPVLGATPAVIGSMVTLKRTPKACNMFSIARRQPAASFFNKSPQPRSMGLCSCRCSSCLWLCPKGFSIPTLRDPSRTDPTHIFLTAHVPCTHRRLLWMAAKGAVG
jgi:hypothetical protein